MAFETEFDSETGSNPRREKRRQEDKRRMAYRRAIEDYRDSQALHAMVADYPELAGYRLRQGGLQ
ncbi:PA3496 family putative envelope integrity protein [Pseudomonas sp.]|uniref:PA3496 family putative envelope integrity protein n=1 Tax=Pseudomonas sp. TaxID=306 RepID=UPI00272B3D53|nr:hypothetical protein [Pseudomonas sp.]